jgi:hypothetical protein
MPDYCGICAAELPARRPGAPGRPQLYCKPDTGRPCQEYARRLVNLQTEATAVIRGVTGAGLQKAFRGIETAYRRAMDTIKAAEHPEAAPPKRARRKPGASGRDVLRAWCVVCGAELAPRSPGAPGRPPSYCKPDTGRACDEFGKRLDDLARRGVAIVLASPPEVRERVIRGLVGDVRDGPLADVASMREDAAEASRRKYRP